MHPALCRRLAPCELFDGFGVTESAQRNHVPASDWSMPWLEYLSWRSPVRPGYLQGSYLCSACASGYHLNDAGRCDACPAASPWQSYSVLIFLVATVMGLVLIVIILSGIFLSSVGGTFTGSLTRISSLIFWSITCLQVVSDAASVLSSSLPPLVTMLYEALSVLQLQGVLQPTACTGAMPFTPEVSMLSVALGLWVATVCLFYCAKSPRMRLAGQFALMLTLVLYPATTADAVGLLSCQSVTISAQSASSLDGGPPFETTQRSRDAIATLAVSSLDSSFVCWQGHHRVPAYLAALALPVYVFGLPALLFLWLLHDPWAWVPDRLGSLPSASKRHKSSHNVRSCCSRPHIALASRTAGDESEAAPLAGSFSGANPLRRRQRRSHNPTKAPKKPAFPDHFLGFMYDCKSSAWYTVHMDLAVLLLLSLFRALLPRPTDLVGITVKTAVICGALLFSCIHVLWMQPYPDAWRGWLRALSLLDALSITLLAASALALDAGLGGVSLSASIVAGGYAVFALCVVTFTVLLIGILWQGSETAWVEQAAIDAKQLAEEGRLSQKQKADAAAAAPVPVRVLLKAGTDAPTRTLGARMVQLDPGRRLLWFPRRKPHAHAVKAACFNGSSQSRWWSRGSEQWYSRTSHP